ncbi:hypothetical protein BJ138DRAFT_1117429 [Hygrophoropsis aurantiaca]|uniref:Uncharacterized protein n=1 Tax=Hygrophoropsis aurantiaca TaxID=72124 RepID=A0ACB8A0W6_9AGAM|nr:hypothetical protein BJ138DRAFT_1117429 [Hygrophoropsis aurantiaca]
MVDAKYQEAFSVIKKKMAKPEDEVLVKDIPLGVDSLNLSGRQLQAIVVNALKLDHNWRKPDAYIQRAIPLINSGANTSSVDCMHLLPGGKWLITTHCIYSHSRQHAGLILWCLDDMTSPQSIITVPIHGDITSCQAHYQPAQHKFTIAVVLEKDDSEWVEFYHISSDNPAVVTHSESLVMPPAASDEPLPRLCNIDNFRIYGDMLGATYHQLADWQSHPETVNVYLRNLVTGATTTFKACEGDWHCDRIAFDLFGDQCALIWDKGRDFSSPVVSFYDIPPSIISANPEPTANGNLDHMHEGILSGQCRLPHSGWFHSWSSSGSLEHGVHILNTMTFSGAPFGVIMDCFSPPDHETRLIGCPTIVSQMFPRHAALGNLRILGAMGRRAVWVDIEDGIIFKKWSASRYCRGEELSAGVSVLRLPTTMPPFDKQDIYWIAFDEATCRLCICFRTGEIYVCDFL